MKPTLVLVLSLLSLPVLAEKATVQKTAEGWVLMVNNAPYWINGVGLNEPEDRSKSDLYLQMAQEMGANSIRTWGGASRAFFDKAHQRGLSVNAGFWVNPVRHDSKFSYRDPKFRAELKKEALAYVSEMKDHPALITWNIGNEIFGFTEDPNEQEALGHFLEDLYKAVHKLDPDHPIMFASASTRDIPYLVKWTPSVDIIGINMYGGLPGATKVLKSLGWDKPLVASEFGPIGAWDLRKDRNGAVWEPPDHMKSNQYATIWRHIEAARADYLGGYAFVLGDFRNQDSLSWLNMNFDDQKRDSYWTTYELYTGQKRPNPVPKIFTFHIDRDVQLTEGDTLLATLAIQAPEPKTLTFDFFLSDIATDPLRVEKATLYPAKFKRVAVNKKVPFKKPAPTDSFEIKLPEKILPGVYRIYAKVTDAHKNTTVLTRSVQIRRP